MVIKRKVLVIISVIVAFVLLGVPTSASASSKTVPAKFRGTFYRYSGHKKWDTLIIRKHSAQISGPDYGKKPFKAKANAKANNHKLAFKTFGRYKGQILFTLNSKLKDSSSSMFPENDFSLATRKIKHKRYKVVRGFQSGYWFDFIKGHKITHRYSGLANGKY
ncbi:hypothetical protein [Levilactobacillus mulengensis]|uniref:hypothetical protein n=1 Tax=Levilactobacillus mulengensis TaxID=2486025 RepID=UPI000F779A00|nr:hypothetical protein [Levilactobacillus mulengensis]